MQNLLNAYNYDSFLKLQLRMPQPVELHRNCPLGKRVLAYRGDHGCTPEKLSCWRNATVADGPGRKDAYITVLWADGLTRNQRLHASYVKRQDTNARCLPPHAVSDYSRCGQASCTHMHDRLVDLHLIRNSMGRTNGSVDCPAIQRERKATNVSCSEVLQHWCPVTCARAGKKIARSRACVSPTKLLEPLRRFAKWRWHSQQYQDSILHFLFLSPSYALPPRKTGPPFYVEFGYHGVQDSNTEYLSRAGWSGVRFDRLFHQPQSGLFRQHITASNVAAVFSKFRVPSDVDFVSIDTDTCDLWIFAALVAPETRFRPRVVQIEMNRHDPLEVDRVLNCTSGLSPEETFPEHRKELGRIRYNLEGASVTAIAKVAKYRGYSVLYVEPCYDVYLLRSDLVCPGAEHPSLEIFRNAFARPGEKACGDMHEWVAKNVTQDRVDRWCMSSDEMMEALHAGHKR